MKYSKLTLFNFSKKIPVFKCKSVICVQFSPKLYTLYLMICHTLMTFLILCSIMGYNRSICQFSQKIPFSSKMTIWAQFAPNYLTLYLRICHRVLFWNIFAWWDAIDWQSLYWSVFPRNPLLTQLCTLGTVWAKTIQPYIPGNYTSWFTL